MSFVVCLILGLAACLSGWLCVCVFDYSILWSKGFCIVRVAACRLAGLLPCVCELPGSFAYLIACGVAASKQYLLA